MNRRPRTTARPPLIALLTAAASFALLWSACADDAPASTGGDCQASVSHDACNLGDMISCVICDADGGAIFGVQTCGTQDADGSVSGAYGGCEVL